MIDDVFKALADPTRRRLLDELFEEDGQTLSALEQRLPMTRFGVAKHLKVLEGAGLVERERQGREHLIAVRAAPLREVSEWVSEYERLWSTHLDRVEKYFKEKRKAK